MDDASMKTQPSRTLYCGPHGCSLTPSDPILLFLDFDGVLHPAGAEAEHFVNLPRLERVLRESPGVRVVISSSWQDAYRLRALKGHFAEDIAGRIVGGTRSADPDREADSRYEQIRMYLRRVRHSSIPWVALDDAAHEFPEGCEQLVLCESARGFDDETERRLRTALELIARRASGS
jgi:hypothetical protein